MGGQECTTYEKSDLGNNIIEINKTREGLLTL